MEILTCVKIPLNFVMNSSQYYQLDCGFQPHEKLLTLNMLKSEYILISNNSDPDQLASEKDPVSLLLVNTCL